MGEAPGREQDSINTEWESSSVATRSWHEVWQHPMLPCQVLPNQVVAEPCLHVTMLLCAASVFACVHLHPSGTRARPLELATCCRTSRRRPSSAPTPTRPSQSRTQTTRRARLSFTLSMVCSSPNHWHRTTRSLISQVPAMKPWRRHPQLTTRPPWTQATRRQMQQPVLPAPPLRQQPRAQLVWQLPPSWLCPPCWC